jgi:FkbM family methyltransferase
MIHPKLNSLLRRLLRLLPPRLQLKALTRIDLALGQIETDLVYLPPCVPKHRHAVDVGANNGVTSSVFCRYFSKVTAFEANPDLASRVRPALPAQVTLHTFGLSDAAGEGELRIPVAAGVAMEGWASLGVPHVGEERLWKRVPVALRTMDSFNLEEVDFLKIDVEGHELAVLGGALETIKRCKPWMVIEAWEENRESLISFMRDIGYDLASLEQLCGKQSAPNNLIFLPKEVRANGLQDSPMI